MDLGEPLHPVRQAASVVRLVPIVELLEDTLGELGDDRAEADLACHAQALLRDARQLLDDPEVGLRLGLDPRPLDLDRHERPVVEPRLVDLGGRCRCERDRVERLVQDFSGGEPSSLVTMATTSS